MAVFSFLVLVMSLVISALACDYNECRNEAIDNENDWIECDMCNCDGMDNVGGDSEGTCTTSNDSLYNCYVKFENEDGNLYWSCAIRMEIGYIIMFVFLSLFGCCACMYCCALGEKRRRGPPPAENNLNTYLVTTHNPAVGQPIVVVPSEPATKTNYVESQY